MNTHILLSGTAHEHSARLVICSSFLASPSMRRVYEQLTGSALSAGRTEGVGALVDALIPGADDIGNLLACAVSDPSLLSDEPEDYDHSNTLSPAALLYENLYRQTFAWVETYLGEIVRLAMLIRHTQDESGTSSPEAILDGE